MEPGDIFFMTTANVVSQDGSTRVSFGPEKRGDKMVFMLLGTLQKGKTMQQDDIVKVMAALGWQPIPEDAPQE